MDMWALLVLLVVLPGVCEGHRIYPKSRRGVEKFDVPANAQIVLNGKISCDQKALREHSWHSLVGKAVVEGRKCMGVEEDEPIYVGK